jgi:hypothetical protein
MKLSSASKHLATVGRGGGSPSIDDRNAARGRGIAQEARALTTAIVLVLQLKSHRRWTKMGSNFEAMPTKVKHHGRPLVRKTLTPQCFIQRLPITMLQRYANLLAQEDKRSEINVFLLLKRFMLLQNRPMEPFVSTLLMAAHSALRTLATPLPRRKELKYIISNESLSMVSGGESTFLCPR